MIDLAIEAKYLSVMWHLNIGALKPPAKTGIVYMHAAHSLVF
jgi:hypothetical protein